MSVSSICPDDLLLAVRRGELTPSEDARLAFHLERCARCRAALETGRAFDVVLGARVGDDEIARRIAAQLTGAKSRRWWPFAIGAGLMLSASLAVAAVGVQRFRAIFEAAQNGQAPEPSKLELVRIELTKRSSTSQPEATAPEAAAAAPSSEAVPAVSNESAPSAAVKSRLDLSRADVSHALQSRSGAAELFAQANALRGASKALEAQKRYQELQARYPESSEARVSLVSLGRLELASQPAQALRHFSAYLAQSNHQTLSEEALFGQATALARLGKAEQERAAWRKLLDRFPGSVYAERAKARLTP